MKTSWSNTKIHLENAKQLLNKNLKIFIGDFENFQEYLLHNELGLAFEELEVIGDEDCGSFQFWQEMLKAAEEMEILEKVEKCRSKLPSVQQ